MNLGGGGGGTTMTSYGPAVSYVTNNGRAFMFENNQIGIANFNANSTEMDEQTPNPVIDLMEDQKELSNMGGTMRLGAWACQLEKDSKSNYIYNTQSISERHRHRYEFNNQYKEQLFDDDFKIAGVNPDTQLVEVVENTKHPWFIGVQFHPEYKSTVSNPHPLFVSFIKAALAQAQLKK